MHTPPRAGATGFTLIEIAMVLVIVAVAAVMVMQASTGMRDSERRKTVRLTLDTADAALANFVAAQRRLPCPADGRIASGAANAGVEQFNAASGTCTPVNQQHGVLPWVTLGLPEGAALDPWNARLTYRVDPALAGRAPLPLLMNMSQCDPAATGAAGATGGCVPAVAPCAGSAACTSPASFLANKGLDVWDGRNGAAGFAARQNNRALGTGAAYVLIAHGPGGAGAYGTSGTLQSGSMVANVEDEGPNMNNQAIVLAATVVTAYRDAPLNDNPALKPTVPGPPQPPQALVYFDDYLSHPTIMAVLNKVNLGPRAH